MTKINASPSNSSIEQPNLNFTLFVCLPWKGYSTNVVLDLQDETHQTIQTIVERAIGKGTSLNISVPGNTRRIRVAMESYSGTWHFPFTSKLLDMHGDDLEVECLEYQGH